MGRWRRTAVALATVTAMVVGFSPAASATPVDLKQNNADTVTSGFACAAFDTVALRRYDLDGDHGITLPFTVSSVSHGVWVAQGATNPTAQVELYTIPAADDSMSFADLTAIGSPVAVPLQPAVNHTFTLETTTVDATVTDPVGTDLVVAVRHFSHEGVNQSGPGTNSDGETEPTYVALCNENPPIALLADSIPGQSVPMWPTGEEDTDTDADGVGDSLDNCVDTANEDQADLDGDEQGDVCDPDDDGDTVNDDVDNCPVDSNLDQANNDGDGPGDACDDDDDNDSVLDNSDNCVNDANGDQANLDGDAEGDVCDADDDGDMVDDAVDNCAVDANADQANADGDSFGDVCDVCDDDDDGDTVLDEADACDLLAGNPARPQAQGCPAVPRSLSAHFHVSSGDLDGTLESAAPQCVANVPVVVSWRKNDGTMRKRTTSTDGAGDFAVHTGPVKKEGPGQWYFWVRAPAVLVADVGHCSFTTLRDADTRIHR